MPEPEKESESKPKESEESIQKRAIEARAQFKQKGANLYNLIISIINNIAKKNIDYSDNHLAKKFRTKRTGEESESEDETDDKYEVKAENAQEDAVKVELRIVFLSF